MRQLNALLVTVMVSVASAISTPPLVSCPVAPLTDEQVTPEYLGSFSNRFHLSLDQTVCCLPLEWRENYVVASTSVSAQQSDPHAPRIILYPRARPGRPMARALSFLIDRMGRPITEVSQEANIEASQKYSIEMMDLDNGRPRFSDLRFERDMARDLNERTVREGVAAHQTVAQLNAPHCATCHGARESGQFPIFSFSPIWANTFPKFYKPTACPTEEERLSTEAERGALLEAIRRPNTPFSCLPGLEESVRGATVYRTEDAAGFYARAIDGPANRNKPNASAPRGSLARARMTDEKLELFQRNVANPRDPSRLGLLTETFELNMIAIYNRRAAENIRTHAQYDRLKYAIVGSLIGCIDPDRPSLQSWFSERELARQNAISARSGPPSAQFAAIEAATGRDEMDQTMVRLMTCSGRQALYQQDCFPENCPTIARAVRNIQQTLTRRRELASRAGDANQANASLLRSIARANLELGRNWLPDGPDNRNIDADAWGAFQHVVRATNTDFVTTAEWSALFTGGQSHRSIDGIGRALMELDPELRPMIRPEAESPCALLEAASLRATQSALPSSPTTAPAGASR